MPKEIVEMLGEISSKKAEIVDRTRFDLFEDNLALQVIEERLQSIYSLNESNPDLTREYVLDCIQTSTYFIKLWGKTVQNKNLKIPNISFRP